MKYRRLTREQLEEMHKEFSNFLASQSINVDEWNDIKSNQPKVAEAEIDVFSDLVWEGVLTKVKYLEHFSGNQIHLFYLQEEDMALIAIKVEDSKIDLTTDEGYGWLQENLMDKKVAIFSAKRAYGEDPLVDKFRLIEQGAQITKGNLYEYFAKFVD